MSRRGALRDTLMEGLPSPKEAPAFARERWPLPEPARDPIAR